MTVRELIEELSKLGPDMRVRVWNYDNMEDTSDVWVQHYKVNGDEYCDINVENFE